MGSLSYWQLRCPRVESAARHLHAAAQDDGQSAAAGAMHPARLLHVYQWRRRAQLRRSRECVRRNTNGPAVQEPQPGGSERLFPFLVQMLT